MERFFIRSFNNSQVKLNEKSFVANGTTIIGDVTVGENSSIWYNAVLRGDVGAIVVGECSNIQENSVIHTLEEGKTVIGDFVTIGHMVNLHNVTIEDNVLIGNSAILLDNAKVCKNSIVAAGSLIPPGKIVPEGVLVMGNPYRIVRELKREEIEGTKKNALLYSKLAQQHKKLK